MTVATNQFVLQSNEHEVVLHGRMFNSFLMEAQRLPQVWELPEGQCSPLVGFFSRDRTLPLRTQPLGDESQKYEIEIVGGRTTLKVEGYSRPEVLERLLDPELARPCEGGVNYHGISFIWKGESISDPLEFWYCLAEPPDSQASLELTVTVRKVS